MKRLTKAKLAFTIAIALFLFLFDANFLIATPPNPDASTGWIQNRHYHKPTKSHPAEIFIRFFQKYLSPQDGAVCRFRPTCSRYGMEALRKYGFWKGILLTTDRLARDNPFNEPTTDYP